MQNTNNNLKTVAIFIIIILAIVFGIKFLIKDTENKNTLNDNQITKEEQEITDDTQNQSEEKKDTIIKNVNQEVTTSSNKNMEKVAQNGDTLTMNYTGRLTDGTVFDSSVDPKFKHVQPFTFKLGAGLVIAGCSMS